MHLFFKMFSSGLDRSPDQDCRVLQVLVWYLKVRFDRISDTFFCFIIQTLSWLMEFAEPRRAQSCIKPLHRVFLLQMAHFELHSYTQETTFAEFSHPRLDWPSHSTPFAAY